MATDILRDVGSLPKEERVRALANPQMAELVRRALASDPDYQQLPEGEKLRYRAGFGLSEVQPTMSPQMQDAYRQIPALMELQRGTEEQRLETEYPFSSAIARVLAPLQEAIHDPRTGYAGKIARGALGAVPVFTRPIVESPTNLLTGQPIQSSQFVAQPASPSLSSLITGKPEKPKVSYEIPFWSLENIARVATEALITAPFIPAKTIAAAMPPTTAIFQMFLRNPRLANAVAQPFLIATLGIAPYEVAAKRVTEMMKTGEITLEGIAKDYGVEALNAFAVLLGFKGAAAAAKAGIDQLRPLTTELITQAVESGTKGLKAKVSTPLEMPTPRVESPKPEGTLLDLAQRAITLTPSEGVTIVGSRKPGFLLSAEELRARRISQAEDSALRSNTTVAPDGSIQTEIPEPVLASQFIPARDARPGDLIYVDRGRVVRVIEKTDKGVTVKGESGAQYFLTFDKLGERAEIPYFVGDLVYKAGTNEPLTVKRILSNSLVQVADSKGRTFAMQTSNLLSKGQKLHAQESAERAAMGITDPAPPGETIWDLIPDKSQRPRPPISGGAPMTTHVTISTQPIPGDMGTYRYWITPTSTMLHMNKPEYDVLAAAWHNAKAREQSILARASGMLNTFRGMIGRERGGGRLTEQFRGADKEVSDKLLRAVSGVPLSSDTYTLAERAIIDATQEFARKDVIPRVNEYRAFMGERPVGPDYPWVFRLFPDIIFGSSAKGHQIGGILLNHFTPTGRYNLLNHGVEIEVKGNFWELLDRLYKYVAHEEAWRPVTYQVRDQISRETSAKNIKWLQGQINILDNRVTSPALGEFYGFSSWVDQKVMDLIGKKSIRLIDPRTGNETILDRPIWGSMADMTIDSSVFAMKGLHYAATIGANARTVLLNLSQPITDALARLPGNPLANVLWAGYGYAKGIATLFNKEAQERYHTLGVLTSLEDLFLTEPPMKLTGGNLRNAAYMATWGWHNFTGLLFKGMQIAEVINRAGVYEMRKGVVESIAQRAGWVQSVIQSEGFQRDVQRLSTYTSNMANFLYGKGFKSPAQVGYVEREGRLPLVIPGLGELAYMFNLFGVKHLENMSLLARQAGGHMEAASRMAMVGASPEFAQYLTQLEKPARHALLRALAYQAGLAAFFYQTLGLASLAAQVSPFGLMPGNPVTPLIRNLGETAEHVSKGKFDKALATLGKTFTPAWTAARRFNTASDLPSAFAATQREIKGYGEPPTTWDVVFGRTEGESRRP